MAKKKFTFTPQQRALMQITWWTLALISGLTFLNLLFVIHTVGPGLDLTFEREPASLTPLEGHQPAFKTPVIKFNCENKKRSQQIGTQAPTARILFINCVEIEKVFNASNHSQGAVFPLKNGELTSDFIFLTPGRNKVAVHISGEEYVIEFNRKVEKKKGNSNAL